MRGYRDKLRIANTRWKRTVDLVDAANRLASQLPPTVDAILGVARSGLLAGVTIATRLHLPIYSLALPTSISYCGNGGRMAWEHQLPKHIAIIDDTTASGRTIDQAAHAARNAWPAAAQTRAVIFADPASHQHLDLWAESLNPPHFLEWNFANAPHLVNAAWDFDGLLCEDFPGADNDSPEYHDFLRSAKPLHLPRRNPIRLIITARCSRYRAETLDWLEAHRVCCARLEMGPWPDALSRRIDGTLETWKAHLYATSDSPLMIESCPHLAAAIARLSKKPTLCPTTGELFG